MYPALRSGSARIAPGCRAGSARIASSSRSVRLAFALGLCGLAACDSTATIYISTPKFQQVQVISAYPAKKQPDDSWSRVCGQGAADGIITNVAYLSSQRRSSGSTGAPSDSDVSIRPNDVIDTRVVDGGLPDDINLSSTGNLGLQFDCINPASTSGNDCTNGTTPAAELAAIRYAANTPARGRGHNVMLLVDQSGSVGGLVRDVSFKEERIPNPLPQNFGEVASDRTGLRLAAARRLLGILNTEDRFGALAFGEGINLSVPCTGAINDVAGRPRHLLWRAQPRHLGRRHRRPAGDHRRTLEPLDRGQDRLRVPPQHRARHAALEPHRGPDRWPGHLRRREPPDLCHAVYDRRLPRLRRPARDRWRRPERAEDPHPLRAVRVARLPRPRRAPGRGLVHLRAVTTSTSTPTTFSARSQTRGLPGSDGARRWPTSATR